MSFNYDYLNTPFGKRLTPSEVEAHKSMVRVDEVRCMLSAMKMKLSDEGLTDLEWMKLLSEQVSRYIARLSYDT